MGNCQSNFISPTFSQEPNKATRVSRSSQTPVNQRQPPEVTKEHSRISQIRAAFRIAQIHHGSEHIFSRVSGSDVRIAHDLAHAKNLFTHTIFPSTTKRNVSNNQVRVLN